MAKATKTLERTREGSDDATQRRRSICENEYDCERIVPGGYARACCEVGRTSRCFCRDEMPLADMDRTQIRVFCAEVCESSRVDGPRESELECRAHARKGRCYVLAA